MGVHVIREGVANGDAIADPELGLYDGEYGGEPPPLDPIEFDEPGDEQPHEPLPLLWLFFCLGLVEGTGQEE